MIRRLHHADPRFALVASNTKRPLSPHFSFREVSGFGGRVDGTEQSSEGSADRREELFGSFRSGISFSTQELAGVEGELSSSPPKKDGD